MSPEHTARVRALNDHLRQTGCGGRIMATQGVIGRGAAFVKAALIIVATFDAFSDDNDPWREHDFGAFEIEGEPLYWKIDYYDLSYSGGAENPADASTCRRVLTLMLASEY